jgi:uncharacterized membrane protein
MNHQPKIKPELANSDRLIELLSIVVLGMIWGLLIFYYAKMPDIVPVHFDVKGQPDAYGSKHTLVVLPVIAVLLFTGMTILNRFPHIFNYPVKITPENALRQYSVATRLIRILKLVIMFVFLMIEYFTVRTALHHAAGFGVWFIPVFLMMVNIPVIYYIMLSFRKK